MAQAELVGVEERPNVDFGDSPSLDDLLNGPSVKSDWSREQPERTDLPAELMVYDGFKTSYSGVIGEGEREKMIRLYFPKDLEDGVKVYDPQLNRVIDDEQKVLRLLQLFEYELFEGGNVEIDMPEVDAHGNIIPEGPEYRKGEEELFIRMSIEATRKKYARRAERFKFKKVQGEPPKGGINIRRVERDYRTGKSQVIE